MFDIPAAFARDTIAREGDTGRAWIDALPDLVAELCTAWNLTVDGAPMHGYLGLVTPVRRLDEPCILKVSWRDEFTDAEAWALATWNGGGAVQLLAADPERGALLLERLDHRHTLDDVPIDHAGTIAGRLLHRLAVPAPPGIRPLHARAAELVAELPARWEAQNRPMPRPVLDEAVALARELGAETQSLLTNHDLHYQNVLRGTREPWLVIDPKPLAGDPEYGVAQLLVNRLEEIEGGRGLDHFIDRLIHAAQLDAARTRGWTLVRCVDYWLWGLSVGLTEDPARCAHIVARLRRR